MTNKKNSENEYGIDLTKNYSGEEVLSMINIIMEEADSSIEQSFYEGYKLGKLEFEPELLYWKSIAETKKRLSFEEKFFSSAIGFGIGFVTGGAAGFYIKMNTN